MTSLDGKIQITSSGYIDSGDCRPQCTLSSEPSYVIYSASGSFFVPMIVMIFFNWRIYTTAKRTTKAILQGYTKVKSDGRYIGGMGVHKGRKQTNLIKLKVNGEYQSDLELTQFNTQFSVDSRSSNDSYYRKNSFTSKSLTGKCNFTDFCLQRPPVFMIIQLYILSLR